MLPAGAVVDTSPSTSDDEQEVQRKKKNLEQDAGEASVKGGRDE